MYEWDEEKSERNREKHGLSFEDAEKVFSGPCVTFLDERFDYEETRLITLGSLEAISVIPQLARTTPSRSQFSEQGAVLAQVHRSRSTRERSSKRRLTRYCASAR